MANNLITPSTAVRCAIGSLAHCFEFADFAQGMDDGVFIATAEIPFNAADVTLCIDDFVDRITDAIEQLGDELLYAKRTCPLPLPPKTVCARHLFAGLSMLGTLEYRAFEDEQILKLEVGYLLQ
jgi:hypothetical protein